MSNRMAARKYKIGKTEDSGRHLVKIHREGGHVQKTVAEKIGEEETKKYRDIRDRAEQALDFLWDTAVKAKSAAVGKGDMIRDDDGNVIKVIGWEPQDFESSARCLSEYTRLIQVLQKTEGQTEQSKSGLAEMREILKAQRGERVRGMETVSTDEQSV